MVAASAGHAGRPPHFCVVAHPSLTPKNPRGLPPGSRLLTIGSEFLKSLSNKPKGAKSRGWGWGPFRRPAEGARWPTQGTAPLPASGPGARSGRRGGCPQASGGIVPLPLLSQAPQSLPAPASGLGGVGPVAASPWDRPLHCRRRRRGKRPRGPQGVHPDADPPSGLSPRAPGRIPGGAGFLPLRWDHPPHGRFHGPSARRTPRSAGIPHTKRSPRRVP